MLPLLELKNLLEFDEQRLYEDFYEMFKSYPENILAQKFIHFRVFEKPFKYAFQGEDRHRNYFWNVSPFWSFPFFNYIMNCPDEIKKKHKAFKHWIQSYSKGAAELEYPNFRSPITSVQGKLFMAFVYHVYPKIPLHVKHLLKFSFFPGNPLSNIDSSMVQCLSKQRNKKSVSEYLHLPADKDLANLRQSVLYTILTLSSAIELYNGEPLTLNEFLNNDF